MARGNIIQGQASGKLGDTVLMVRNGQQVQRVYTKAGARSGNQASEAARIQRVKFGSASNQWGLYRYVCTRMYRKGRKNTQSDYNYFVKRNQSLFPYLSKLENANGVHVLMPGIFSEGNLGRIELVHALTENPSAGSNVLVIHDLNSTGRDSCTWSQSVAEAKTALKNMYPVARKITYLFSIPTEVQIEEEGQAFVSQFVSHHTVVFDLYKESTTGENSMTVIEFMKSQVSDVSLQALFDSQSERAFIYNDSALIIGYNENVKLSTVNSLGVLIFATDDNASDCYSTILQDSSIPSTYGPYAVWAGYRTENSLRIAADSYGYQTGVMRDEIASFGNEIADRMAQYASKVRAFDEDLAKTIETQIKKGEVVARTVRKTVAPTEE